MRISPGLAVVTIGAFIACTFSYAQSPAVRTERNLLAAVNQARRSQGLSPMRWDESLAAAARRHAAVMAEHGSAQHTFGSEPSLSARVKQTGAHFTWLSENVAQGPTAEFIQAQFMHSPSHRANILDVDMNSIGIGVVEQSGQLFAVEDFAQVH
ncbi:MAG: CAP domain-containing protein [Terriglobales bacterium]